MHSLYFCPRALNIWRVWNPNLTIFTTNHALKFHWLQAIILEMNIAWAIWNSKNEMLFNQVSFPASHIVDRSMKFFISHPDAISNYLDSSLPPQSNPVIDIGIPNPSNNNLLICIDGAYKENNGSYGGYILLNNRIVFSCTS